MLQMICRLLSQTMSFRIKKKKTFYWMSLKPEQRQSPTQTQSPLGQINFGYLIYIVTYLYMYSINFVSTFLHLRLPGFNHRPSSSSSSNCGRTLVAQFGFKPGPVSLDLIREHVGNLLYTTDVVV